MTEVYDDIVEWLHERQYWLQVAAEKVLSHNVLSDDDISELCTLLKTGEGQRTDVKGDFSEFSGTESTYEQLKINSIGGVQGIDNLAPRTPLLFGKRNLTVIYGNNGSGKSGYTRILKKVCGKANAIILRPNIFQPPPAVKQCEIGYSIDGVDKIETWIANSDAIDALKNVDVFDAHTGKIYLDNEADAAYIPETVALFEDLVSVCKRIKVLLERERNTLHSKLPNVPLNYIKTKYGVALTTRIKAGVDEKKLKQFFEYTEDDKTNKKGIEERLRDDPVVLAKKKRQQKQQIETLVNEVYKAVEKVNSSACKNIYQLQKDAKDKRKIAVEGAAISLDKAILPGIGTETWMAMWQAARLFSDSTGYPENKFPKTDDDSHCVLCQQALDIDARKRLNDFEVFVNSALEEEAAKAEKAYINILDNLPVIPTSEQLKTSIQAAQLTEDDWLPILNDIWKYIQNYNDLLKKEHDEVLAGYELPFEVFKPIADIVAALDEQVVQHNSDAEKFDKTQLTKDLNDLKAKEWASGYLDVIIEEVSRLDQVKFYNDWIALTNHRAISIKAGAISGQVITQAYVDRFNDELSLLGAKDINVELVKTRVEDGKVKHKVQLHGLIIDTVKAPDILSEGENRIVSLAAFLADVTGKPQNTPFIFDDPISSLDLDYESEVARRIIDLSIERQVLVFTHRLSLYGSLEDWAKKKGDEWYKKNLTQCCIEAFEGTTGHMVPPDTWTANTQTANNILISKLGDAKKYADAGDLEIYKAVVPSICSDFRKLLERTIEDDLLTKVVIRHRRSITTDGRLPKLSKISPHDCKYFDDLMTKYSAYEHSQSLEAPKFIPTYQELLTDLETLKNWRSEFKKRSIDDVETV